MFYNDLDGIKRLINNLLFEAKVPSKDIIAFDGPFDLFPHKDKMMSTDGSRYYLKKMRIQVVDCGITNHIDKTNYRLQYCHKQGYDAMLGIDCDEYVLGKWSTFIEHLEMCEKIKHRTSYATCFFDKDGYYDSRPAHQRVFTDLDKIEYLHEHWKVYFKADAFRKQVLAKWIVGGIVIVHDSSIRPKKREKQMNVFQKRLKPLEHKQTTNIVRVHHSG